MAPRGRHRQGGSPAPATVVSGLLGDPSDDDRIEVTFRIEGDRVRLTAGDQELGSWPLDEVSMTSAGTSLWYFEAEGDRLAFVPTRPAALEASALVDEDVSRPRRRSRSRRPRDPEPTRTAAPTAEASPETEPAIPRKPSATGAADRKRRRTLRLRLPKLAIARRPRTRSSSGKTKPTAQSGGRTAEQRDAGHPRRRRYWLASVDFARRRGLFGFDRLPVDESNRDGEHQHTWEHPAAATSGPAQWICTICGGIRR